MKTEAEISAPHTEIYEKLYKELNPYGQVEISANAAAQFLKRSGLNVVQLSQIWELTDYRKKGSLDRIGTFVAFKLVAGAQQGRPIELAVLNDTTLNPPKFDCPIAPSPSPSQDSGPPPQVQQRSASVTSRSSIGGWTIDNAEQAKYEAIFYSLNPVNGKLNGDQCRPVLLNSQLPQIQLAKIWELADIDRDSHLDKYEMCIALHLVYKCLQNEPLPDRLPISLIHPMKRVQCNISSTGMNSMSPSRRESVPAASPDFKAANLRSPSITSLPKTDAMVDSTSISFKAPDGSFTSIFDEKKVWESWPVDVTKYEAAFQEIDTDLDGLINGTDARSYLLGFGLSQSKLAQIWTLVDTAKIGRLNLEQFALVNQLIKESQNGVTLPDHLPSHIIPPSMRLKPVSRMSSSSTTSLGAATPSANPRIDELNTEIEQAMENRRKAEQDLFQLEADTLVKNSEVKNLELELQTLSATVKQLQNQKVEATKRLLELDNKILKLEGNCAEQTERMTAEEERLSKVKQEIAQAKDNYNAEEEALKGLRQEAKSIDEKYIKAKADLAHESLKMEGFVDELTMMERQMDSNAKEVLRVEKLTLELQELLEKLDGNVEGNGVDNEKVEDGAESSPKPSLSDEEILRLTFEKILLTENDGMTSSFSAAKIAAASFPADPFKDDPFENTDEKAASTLGTADPFGGAALEDPFAGCAPANANSGGDFADFSKFATFAS